MILASKWGLYLANLSDAASATMLQEYVRLVTAYLQSEKTIFLVYPVPAVPLSLAHRTAKEAFFSRTTTKANVTASYQAYKADANTARVRDSFDRLGEHRNLIRIEPDEILCNTFVKDGCVVELDGVRLYVDENHLSNAGARLIVAEVMKHVRTSNREQPAS